MDTIFALSTRAGKAGVAIIRISGKQSFQALEQLIRNDVSKLKPRICYYRKIYDLEQNVIDQAIIILFKAPHSFTGEDVVELHLHGSIAVVNLVIECLYQMKNLRLAEAGEFSKIAFLNNKMDLTAAEGLVDLINAETKLQHKQAIKQSMGALESLYNNWQKKLLNIIALLEAYIDFPDEEIPQSVINETNDLVQKFIQSIQQYLNDNRKGELLRNGIKLALIGEPNVGKSSLLNFLLQREVAIVSNQAGTTRDIIEGHLDINGYPIILQDTAGIRTSDFEIEQEGIKRSIITAKISDIKLIMLGADSMQLPKEIQQLIDEDTIILINKIDLIKTVFSQKIYGKIPLFISIKNNIGLDNLLNSIENLAQTMTNVSELPSITRIRYRNNLEIALNYLYNFSIEDDLVLAAENIRLAIRAIQNITGKITVDDILGEIFGSFCIGK